MKTLFTVLTPAVLILFAVSPSFANQSYLSMCIRDGNNILKDAKRLAAKNDHDISLEFYRPHNRLQRFEKYCFVGKKAESIKDLPDFAKVIQLRDEARSLLDGVQKRIDSKDAIEKEKKRKIKSEQESKREEEKKRRLEKEAEEKRRAEAERKRLESLPTGIFWKDFEPGMKNRKLKKEVMTVLQETASAGKWQEKFTDIKIESKDWSIRRNALGVILQREISVWALGTWPDEKCKVSNFSFAQEYNGSGYNQSIKLYSYGLIKRIDCD